MNLIFKIQTNDVVQLNSETTFEWIGRYDNVINSGGLKLHPEQIENKLASKIDCRYFIASEEDDLLGQRVILVLESKENKSATYDFSVLEKHEIPKAIYVTPKFSETKTGKINRNMTLEILN